MALRDLDKQFLVLPAFMLAINSACYLVPASEFSLPKQQVRHSVPLQEQWESSAQSAVCQTLAKIRQLYVIQRVSR